MGEEREWVRGRESNSSINTRSERHEGHSSQTRVGHVEMCKWHLWPLAEGTNPGITLCEAPGRWRIYNATFPQKRRDHCFSRNESPKTRQDPGKNAEVSRFRVSPPPPAPPYPPFPFPFPSSVGKSHIFTLILRGRRRRREARGFRVQNGSDSAKNILLYWIKWELYRTCTCKYMYTPDV